MNWKQRYFHSYTELSEEQAEQLRYSANPGYTVEVKPPVQASQPATLEQFIRGVQELQTKWLGTRNTSPITAFEIRRAGGNLSFQFTVPTKRLERKVRAHLSNQIPEIRFEDGSSGLPVVEEDAVGGGILTSGRRDHYPFEQEFDNPPMNALAAALHRHSMQDTKIVVQVLFQPAVGNPVRNWWWTRRAYKRIGYLRKEKEKLWNYRSATPREKHQATAIEEKAGTNRFHTTVRFVVIGAGEYTRSRVKELSGAFNIFENPETGQYFDTVTVQSLWEDRIIDFCRSVADRGFHNWSLKFQVGVPELAALVSIPNRQQENISYAQA